MYVEDEFDCGTAYEEEEIHSTGDPIIEGDNIRPKSVPGVPEAESTSTKVDWSLEMFIQVYCLSLL